MANGKDDQKETKEIRSKIFEQKRELLIKIPIEIVENFHINPDREEFGWFIQEIGKDNQERDIVTVFGKFLRKLPNEKKD